MRLTKQQQVVIEDALRNHIDILTDLIEEQDYDRPHRLAREQAEEVLKEVNQAELTLYA